MNKIIILAAAASVLSLAACNREAETAPTADASMTPADATAADSAGMNASTTAGSGSGSGSTGGAMAAGGSGAASETMDPAGSSMVGSTGVAPVSPETRDNAKMAAEETNLHPKPPTN